MSALAKSARPPSWGPDTLASLRTAREAQQDAWAEKRDHWVHSNPYFYTRMKQLLRWIVDPGKRVLELRCQTGHLLASVEPSEGVGVEISKKLVDVAQHNYPHLKFMKADPEEVSLPGTFDYILVSHIFDTVDVLAALDRAHRASAPHTRVLVMNYNPLWQPLLNLASRLGWRAPFVEPNWISVRDLQGFLRLAKFEVIRTHHLLLLPKKIPLLSWFMNDFLERLPGIRNLCLMHVVVARPEPVPVPEERLSVSVIIPCRNERDNIAPAVGRIPEMGCHTEIIFCDDQSTDGTADEVRRMIACHPDRDIRLVTGPAISKAENVWTGFRAATGEVLVILDGDLAVMPEELPLFLRTLASGRGEMINGSRLVYPIARHAMKFTNFAGNKVFGWLFSYLLDQRIKDTLCGTKMIFARDWHRIETRTLGKWGVKDLWGDYELLFGASRLHLAIRDVPVHYQERVYGVTKMTRVFANGLRMLRICFAVWRRGKHGD